MRLALACLLFAFAFDATAVPLDLSYTVIGAGGTSGPVDFVSDTSFRWIDSTGTASAQTEINTSGFEPFPAFDKMVDQFNWGGGGSLLLSSPFQLTANDTLVVDYSMLRARAAWLSNGDMDAPVGFALLLQNGNAPIVLGNMTAEGVVGLTSFGVDNPNSPFYLSPDDRRFTPTSQGVTINTNDRAGIDLTLNGLRYGQPETGGGGLCGCILDVTSTYTPGAGEFQLLFGIFNLHGINTEPSIFGDAALAVRGAQSVPEPATLTLFGAGLIGMLAARKKTPRPGRA